ncbi:MAG: cadmium-translocating P-type ATPase [Erysipelotrichales bacterium]|nr:MAG: cadmium-translocating P-type ATPase [Erysipelotrichales bacterium]
MYSIASTTCMSKRFSNRLCNMWRNVMQHIVLTIEGMDCANCALKVEKELNRQEDIQEAKIDFARGKVLLTLSEGVRFEDAHLERWQSAVKKIEDVRLISHQLPKTPAHKKISNNEWILIFAAVAVIGSFFIAHIYYRILLAIIYVPIAFPILRKAVANLRNGVWFDETFLMSIATLGAMAIGDVSEALGVMVFYRVGEALQSRAIDASRKTIEACLKSVPTLATVLRGGKTSELDPKLVFIGDILVIAPGALIPLDGIVVEGDSSLDVSSLTGESAAVSVGSGSQVLSGSINQQARFLMKVTKRSNDSTLQRMVAYVEEASAKKAPLENYITKFARVYTPTVVLLSILVALILGFSGQGWLVGVHRALIFLVISCPCALLISIPLGFYAALGKASSLGILVKGGVSLQHLAAVEVLMIDKTGTLTKGSFAVSEVVTSGHNAEHILEIAAYGEASSTHPLAKAVLDAYGKPIDFQRIRKMEEIPGVGLKLDFDDATFYLGNGRLADRLGVDIPATFTDKTVIHVVKEKEYLGTLILEDEIKKESSEAIKRLHQDGLKVILVSGDNTAVVQKVADKLKLDGYYGDCRPEDKVRILKAAKAQGQTVAFAGDGMNDAAVLALADVSVAMGAMGSDTAIEAADVVLTHDNPLALSDAVRLSRRTMFVLKENLIFVLGVKIAILILGSLGLASMGLAVFADVGVAILAILNAMRVVNGGNYALDRH